MRIGLILLLSLLQLVLYGQATIGFIDFDGETILPCSLDYYFVSRIYNSLAICMIATEYDELYRYSLLNVKGEVQLPVEEFTSLSFLTHTDSGNLYTATKIGKEGVITENGEVIIQFEYDDIYLCGDLICLALGESYNDDYMEGYSTLDGEIVWEPSF